MALLIIYCSVAKTIVSVYTGINVLTSGKTVFRMVENGYQIKDRFSVTLVYLKVRLKKYEILIHESIN